VTSARRGRYTQTDGAAQLLGTSHQ